MKLSNQKELTFNTLHETANWKMKELEHFLFLKKVISSVDPEHLINFKRWEDTLYITYRHVQRFIESATRSKHQFTPLLYDQVLELIKSCLQESVDFIQFCRQAKTASVAIENSFAAQKSIDQVVDQSDYFIGFAQTVLYARR